MVRPLRIDHPQAIHHVTARGQGHSPLFETQADVEQLLSLLARTVEAGRVRVHAYCVLATHMHLLVESVRGGISAAMQRVMSLYAQYYNRTRERHGHAFDGRFFSRVIEDDVDLACCAGYLDRNAFAAGMVDSPADYAHGSARFYARGDLAPAWLSRDLLEGLVCRITGAARFRPELYPTLWTLSQSASARALVERGLGSSRVKAAPLMVLMRGGPEYVQRWLVENLAREEGRREPRLVVAGEDVLARLPSPPSAADAKGRLPERLSMHVGLLRWSSGWTTKEIARALAISPASVTRAAEAHVSRMMSEDSYARAAAEVLSAAMVAAYGTWMRTGRNGV